MKTLEFIYQENEIHFLVNTTDKNVMINATEMAKLFNKRIDVFLKSDHAKAFISLLEFTPYGGNSNPLLYNQIIKSKGHQGTYITRILALKFAAWLDPTFELWVYSTIDTILFGEYEKHQKAIIDQIQAEKEIIELEQTLINNPSYQRIIDLKALVKSKDNEKRAALKAKLNQIKIDFQEPKNPKL